MMPGESERSAYSTDGGNFHRVAQYGRFSSQPSMARRPREAAGLRAPAYPACVEVSFPQSEWDGAFAFLLFAPSLFLAQLGMIGALVILAFAVVYTGMRTSQLFEVLAPRAFVLAIPFIALFSTIWSEVPKDTLKYSLEFALTVGVGLLLSASPRPKEVLWGIFLAFGLHVILALAFGHSVNIGITGQTAFSGLTDSKNLLADITSTGLLLSIAILFIGIQDRSALKLIVAVLVGAGQVYILSAAHSAGAMLGLAAGLGVFLFTLFLRALGQVVRVIATVCLAISSTVVALIYSELSGTVVDAAAQFFGKDTTLTGRTYLWQRASEMIAEKPLLGKGFNAFWLQGNPDAEGMWRYAGIAEREGFNFHNTYIEILVHLGWLGLIIVVATVIVGIMFLIARAMVRPTLTLCFWVGLLTYQLVRTPIETVGITQFYFSTILLFVALGSAFAPRTGTPPMRYFKSASPQAI